MIDPKMTINFKTEQKVVTVNNSDEFINAEITAQAEDNWMVASLLLSGENIIILFYRITQSS